MLLHKDDDRLKQVEADFILTRCKFEDACSAVGGIYMRWFPTTAMPDDEIISVNGVGDTFLGALISAMIESDERVEKVVEYAQRAAAMTLKSPEAVHPDLHVLVCR